MAEPGGGVAADMKCETVGDVVPMKRRNGPKRLLDEHEQLRFILEQPNIILS